MAKDSFLATLLAYPCEQRSDLHGNFAGAMLMYFPQTMGVPRLRTDQLLVKTSLALYNFLLIALRVLVVQYYSDNTLTGHTLATRLMTKC